jgi:hypothetical protein
VAFFSSDGDEEGRSLVGRLETLFVVADRKAPRGALTGREWSRAVRQSGAAAGDDRRAVPAG